MTAVLRFGMKENCRRIRDGFEADGIPMPRIENFCGGVRVTIERTVFVKLSVIGQTGGQTGGQTSGQTGSQTGGQTRERVYELIKTNPYITRDELSKVLGISPSAIQKHIDKLKEVRIRRIGGDFGGHWEIIEK